MTQATKTTAKLRSECAKSCAQALLESVMPDLSDEERRHALHKFYSGVVTTLEIYDQRRSDRD